MFSKTIYKYSWNTPNPARFRAAFYRHVTLVTFTGDVRRADCARSGDFRSITHHFRTRRSVDQTPAVDRYDLQQQQQHQSDAAAAAESLHGDTTMRDEMMHMSQKVMDVVDVRIEGMEDMLQHLQSTVHQLGDKVSSNSLSLRCLPNYCRISAFIRCSRYYDGASKTFCCILVQ